MTTGKAHGQVLHPEPKAADIDQQGLGWKYNYKSGKGPDTLTGGPEVTWTTTQQNGVTISSNTFLNMSGN